jgi:hypothetical protein
MRLLLTLLLSAFGLAAARGQFELTLRAEKSGYLLYEPVDLVCTVRNTSAQAATLGESAPHAVVSLRIRDPQGLSPRRREAPLLEEAIPLESDHQATFRLRLTRAFEITQAGIYTLELQVAQGGLVHTSAKVMVEILRGTEIGRVLGVNPPRLFLISSANRREGVFLYLRVDNPEQTESYGVWEVDRHLAGRPPERLFDGAGRLHLLHQSAPYQFTHVVLSPEGQPVSRQRYKQVFSDTHLRRRPDGSVEVQGGDLIEFKE